MYSNLETKPFLFEEKNYKILMTLKFKSNESELCEIHMIV